MNIVSILCISETKKWISDLNKGLPSENYAIEHMTLEKVSDSKIDLCKYSLIIIDLRSTSDLYEKFIQRHFQEIDPKKCILVYQQDETLLKRILSIGDFQIQKYPFQTKELLSKISVLSNSTSTRNINLVFLDDEPNILKSIGRLLQDTEWNIHLFLNPNEAIEFIQTHNVQVIVSDMKMPEMNGIEFLQLAWATSPDSIRIILSGYSEVNEIIDVINKGYIWKYLSKPWNLEDFIITIQNAIHLYFEQYSKNQFKIENETLKHIYQDSLTNNMMIGNSEAIQNLLLKIQKIANIEATTLITGETGCGKGLIAKQIQLLSNRREAPFIVVDCGSLPASLLESELFGHAKGAFTGANQDKEGLLLSAGTGTLFLDEIGEMPLEMQSRLLRVLQENQIRPVGSNAYKPVKARIIAATNKDLKQEVQNGNFREDLYYRLHIIHLNIPPLRARKDDIPDLIFHFLHRHSTSNIEYVIPENELATLIHYEWPGNVRELENSIIKAIALADSHELKASDIIDSGFIPLSQNERSISNIESDTLIKLSDYEKSAIENALSISQGNRREASQLLGISEATLYRKLKEHQIT